MWVAFRYHYYPWPEYSLAIVYAQLCSDQNNKKLPVYWKQKIMKIAKRNNNQFYFIFVIAECIYMDKVSLQVILLKRT